MHRISGSFAPDYAILGVEQVGRSVAFPADDPLMVLGIAFRLFLFTSWDQVLVRMNSPPEQLPPYRSALCRVGTGSLQRPDFGSGGPATASSVRRWPLRK